MLPMKARQQALAASIGFALLAPFIGCGSPGPPEPPSLELPRVVTDLRASRKGDQVSLVWTVPTKTTDLQNVRHLGPTLICRSPRVAANKCVAVGQMPVSELMPHRPSPNQKVPAAPVQVTYIDTLPSDFVQQHPLATVSYAVETQNPDHRSAGLSNQVQIPLVPTLPAPADLKGTVTADGVVLTWTGVQQDQQQFHYLYRVYRREAGTNKDAITGELALGSTPDVTFTDRSFEWEKTYSYRVTAVTVFEHGVTPVQVEGADSPIVTLTAKDVFPPGVPSGVQAVASGVGQQPFIDLTWPPVSDADVAGYNIYRREEGQSATKVNADLLKTPAFRDINTQPGHTYFYSVSAVDLRGNESGRSEETSETIPTS